VPFPYALLWLARMSSLKEGVRRGRKEGRKVAQAARHVVPACAIRHGVPASTVRHGMPVCTIGT